MISDILLAAIVGLGSGLIFMLACCIHHLRPRPIAPVPAPLTDLDQMEEVDFVFDADADADADSLGLAYGTECSICCEVMDGKTTIGKIKRCKHSFHRACIMRWYQIRMQQGYVPSCPTCRNAYQQDLILTKVLSI